MKRLRASLAIVGLLATSLVGISASNASAQPYWCTLPFGRNVSDGKMSAVKNFSLRSSFSSDCKVISLVPKGKKLYLWCHVYNSHGNQWFRVRIAGTEILGWAYTDNVRWESGSINRCPGAPPL
jgi:hypothetical protein